MGIQVYGKTVVLFDWSTDCVNVGIQLYGRTVVLLDWSTACVDEGIEVYGRTVAQSLLLSGKQYNLCMFNDDMYIICVCLMMINIHITFQEDK